MPKQKESQKAQDALNKLVNGTRNVAGETTKVSRGTTKSSLKNTSSKKNQAVRQEAEEMMEGAIHAGSETDTNLGSVAKDAVIAVMQEVEGASGATKRTLGDVARSAVRGTSEVGGDVVKVAVKVVEGASEVGDKVGLKAEEAALAAATGAINAAEEISGALATAVTKAISGTFSGLRFVFDIPPKKPRILVVDSNQSNIELVKQHFEEEGFQTSTASSLAELDKIIKGKEKITLSLVDLSGFDQGIWERCETLHKEKIPFIIISPQRSLTIQRDSMKHGASGLLIKPLGINELLEYVHTLLGD